MPLHVLRCRDQHPFYHAHPSVLAAHPSVW
jgi:hypothetical protein